MRDFTGLSALGRLMACGTWIPPATAKGFVVTARDAATIDGGGVLPGGGLEGGPRQKRAFQFFSGLTP